MSVVLLCMAALFLTLGVVVLGGLVRGRPGSLVSRRPRLVGVSQLLTAGTLTLLIVGLQPFVSLSRLTREVILAGGMLLALVDLAAWLKLAFTARDSAPRS